MESSLNYYIKENEGKTFKDLFLYDTLFDLITEISDSLILVEDLEITNDYIIEGMNLIHTEISHGIESKEQLAIMKLVNAEKDLSDENISKFKDILLERIKRIKKDHQ